MTDISGKDQRFRKDRDFFDGNTAVSNPSDTVVVDKLPRLQERDRLCIIVL